MNLISGTYHLCERREYAFMVLWEYTIISRPKNTNNVTRATLPNGSYFLKKCCFNNQIVWLATIKIVV